MPKFGKTTAYVLGALVLAALVLVACQAAPTLVPTQPPAPTAPVQTAVPTSETAPAAAEPAPNKPAAFVVFSPGTKNVPPGVPVYLRAGTKAGSTAEAAPVATINVVAMNPSMGGINPDTGRPVGIKAPRADKNPPTTDGVGDGKYAWVLTKAPEGSTAALAKEVAEVPGLGLDVASFTPDKEGKYEISLVVTDDQGKKSDAGQITITAAQYVGSETCKVCHKTQYEDWKATQHGTAFERFVNENAEGEYFSAGYGCARCHTVGYYPVAENTGGWWQLLASPDNWPKNEIALNAFNEEEGKDTFHTSFSTEVQAVSDIGCESCHGPASLHIAAPGPDSAPMPVAGSSSCNQCHEASGHHTRGNAVANSAHAMNGTDATSHTDGRPECAQCHSPQGHIDFLNGGTAVNTAAGELGCSVCHDPHNATNSFQLREVDKVTVDGTEITDAGLSAGCMSCHNSNSDAKSVETDAPSYPHYSSAADQINGIGGYDFGFKLVNGYHTNIGKGVINDEHTNQPGNMAFTQVNDGKAPGACVLCHMYQTPGGVWDTTDSLKVPGHQEIGGHTFSMETDVNGEVVQQTAPCQQCHPGITSFDFTAAADYDGNGKAEGVQTEVKGLLDQVEAAIEAKGVTKQDGYPYFVIPANPSVELKGAIYNFRYVNGVMWTGEGKGAAIHNFDRSVGLLQASYFKLTGADIPNATLLYSK